MERLSSLASPQARNQGPSKPVKQNLFQELTMPETKGMATDVELPSGAWEMP